MKCRCRFLEGRILKSSQVFEERIVSAFTVIGPSPLAYTR